MQHIRCVYSLHPFSINEGGITCALYYQNYQTGVWTICHWLRFGHETLVYAECISLFAEQWVCGDDILPQGRHEPFFLYRMCIVSFYTEWCMSSTGGYKQGIERNHDNLYKHPLHDVVSDNTICFTSQRSPLNIYVGIQLKRTGIFYLPAIVFSFHCHSILPL